MDSKLGRGYAQHPGRELSPVGRGRGAEPALIYRSSNISDASYTLQSFVAIRRSVAFSRICIIPTLVSTLTPQHWQARAGACALALVTFVPFESICCHRCFVMMAVGANSVS